MSSHESDYERIISHYSSYSAGYLAAYYWLRTNAKHPFIQGRRGRLYHRDDIAAFKAQYKSVDRGQSPFQKLLLQHLTRPMTSREILELLDTKGIFYERTSLYGALRYGLSAGWLERTGQGGRKDPYVYRLSLAQDKAA